MLKVFLSSHGFLAKGLESSSSILLGKFENLTVFSAYVDDNSFNLAERLDDFFKEVKEDDQVLLCSDFYGGSVNQTMFPYLDRKNTYLVTGVNLPFLIAVLTLQQSFDENVLVSLIEQSRQDLRQVKLDDVTIESAEDDFF